MPKLKYPEILNARLHHVGQPREVFDDAVAIFIVITRISALPEKSELAKSAVLAIYGDGVKRFELSLSVEGNGESAHKARERL